MRPFVVRTLCTAALVAVAGGCQQSPPPPEPAASAPTAATLAGRPGAFSADRAWADLQALTQIGPRVVGTEGNARAREYIRGQLEAANLEVEISEGDLLADTDAEADESDPAAPAADEVEQRASLFVHNVHATIRGEMSNGAILLVAPYDSRAYADFEFVGANDGASGAAVLLELARVIAADPLPYTTEVVFLDAQAPFSAGGDARLRRFAGIARLARDKRDQGASDIHLLVYLNRVGDADLRIARDLLSHRIYREEFWKAADRLGKTGAFAPAAPFESTGLRFRPLSKVGIRRVVSLVDTAYGGDEPPGLYAGTAQDTLERCSRESLGTVGSVVLEGLDAISQWLMRIDRFSQAPADAQAATAPQPAPAADPTQ